MLPSAEIKQELQKLVGLPAWKATFAAGTLSVQFGGKRETTTRNGKATLVGERALHIQALWRLSTSDEIIIGSIDHHCHDERDNTPQILAIVEKALLRGPSVLAVECVRAGAFALALEGGLYLEVVPAPRPSDEADEFWRLLSPEHDKPHFVVTSNGIE
ncbi:hypothetical protein ACG04R_27240 [Roseateles sp. BYS78W]|uniref:Uncharacterized protein n=1 Tax=Pelomonas candidula TaxID=3299025 RepID=A0ABW7HKD9_9BURK